MIVEIMSVRENTAMHFIELATILVFTAFPTRQVSLLLGTQIAFVKIHQVHSGMLQLEPAAITKSKPALIYNTWDKDKRFALLSWLPFLADIKNV